MAFLDCRKAVEEPVVGTASLRWPAEAGIGCARPKRDCRARSFEGVPRLHVHPRGGHLQDAELGDVTRDRVRREPVAGSRRFDCVGSKGRTQPHDLVLQGLPGGRWGSVAPDSVDQLVRTDDFSLAKREACEHPRRRGRQSNRHSFRSRRGPSSARTDHRSPTPRPSAAARTRVPASGNAAWVSARQRSTPRAVRSAIHSSIASRVRWWSSINTIASR